MKPLQRQAFFERLRAANPHPTTELKYRNTFQLLVAVILSAQATDKSVNLATAPLFKTIQTPEHLLAFGEPRLREAIARIGLFRTKAKNLMATARLRGRCSPLGRCRQRVTTLIINPRFQRAPTRGLMPHMGMG